MNNYIAGASIHAYGCRAVINVHRTVLAFPARTAGTGIVIHQVLKKKRGIKANAIANCQSWRAYSAVCCISTRRWRTLVHVFFTVHTSIAWGTVTAEPIQHVLHVHNHGIFCLRLRLVISLNKVSLGWPLGSKFNMTLAVASRVLTWAGSYCTFVHCIILTVQRPPLWQGKGTQSSWLVPQSLPSHPSTQTQVCPSTLSCIQKDTYTPHTDV